MFPLPATATGISASHHRQARQLSAKALRLLADDLTATSNRLDDAISAGYLRLASAIAGGTEQER